MSDRSGGASRFQGSSSISSAEYFGTADLPPAGFTVSAPDLDDVSIWSCPNRLSTGEATAQARGTWKEPKEVQGNDVWARPW